MISSDHLLRRQFLELFSNKNTLRSYVTDLTYLDELCGNDWFRRIDAVDYCRQTLKEAGYSDSTLSRRLSVVRAYTEFVRFNDGYGIVFLRALVDVAHQSSAPDRNLAIILLASCYQAPVRRIHSLIRRVRHSSPMQLHFHNGIRVSPPTVLGDCLRQIGYGKNGLGFRPQFPNNRNLQLGSTGIQRVVNRLLELHGEGFTLHSFDLAVATSFDRYGIRQRRILSDRNRTDGIDECEKNAFQIERILLEAPNEAST